ncbi:hypothetical protein ACFPRA_19975 [Sporosarcina soli]|uniref:Prepilin-type N-terminal cleavage/methylation domain-containing protein n=1 Tax=Sporosarcina soli TaxID=334736 RepID=A0ABW0TS20_9BACL
MRKYHIDRNFHEEGMTLVETLASLVILSLLIIAFLSLFGQSARLNKSSELVMEATYIAQTHMEQIYEISQKTTFGNRNEYLKMDNKYRLIEGEIYQPKKEDIGFTVFVEIKEPTFGTRGSILRVKVYDKSGEKLEALMETVLLWRGEDHE